MIDTQQLLREGIAAAKAGRRDAARQALMQIIEVDERNEQAWIWLAGVVDDPADQRVCLENVLDLNPDNPQAKRGLAWLEQHHPTAATRTDGPPAAPSPDPPPIPAPFSAPVQPPSTGATRQVRDDDRTPLATHPPPVSPPQWGDGGGAPTRPPGTDPTRQLSYDGVTPLATRPKEPVPPPPPPVTEPETDQYPCPYCGTPTLARHRTCPKCHKSLMTRGARREKRSIATTIVGILWIISGIPSILGGLLWVVLSIYDNSSSGTFSSFFGILMLLGGGFIIQLGRAYLQCKPWAYIVNAILLGLSLIGGLFQIGIVILAGVAMSSIAGSIEVSSGALIDLFGSLAVTIICLIVLLGTHLALTILGYRDFYGPRMRMLPEVAAADDVGLYNIGIAFKNRGMWYMAMKTWETAARLSPRQANYRHALGLAYAQLDQFERAISTLQEAIKLDPNDRRIQESLKLVEEKAAKAQRGKRRG